LLKSLQFFINTKPDASLGTHVIILNAHFKNTGSIGYNPITRSTHPLTGNNEDNVE